MRLFVSINLQGGVLEDVRHLQHQLCAFEYARMSPARHVHITLGFLGEIDPDRAEEIARALHGVRFDPFEVRLSLPGYFGSRKQPRVIWLGLSPCEPLVELHCEVERALKGAVTAEGKEGIFRPHITLTRVKQVYAPEKLITSVSAMVVSRQPIRVEGFSLMQSTFQAGGATYAERDYICAAQK